MPENPWRSPTVLLSLLDVTLFAGVTYLSWPKSWLFVAVLATWLSNRDGGSGGSSASPDRGFAKWHGGHP